MSATFSLLCYLEYKRLKKTVGVEWAEYIGLDKTRSQCKHFDHWLKTLEALGTPPSEQGSPARSAP